MAQMDCKGLGWRIILMNHFGTRFATNTMGRAIKNSDPFQAAARADISAWCTVVFRLLLPDEWSSSHGREHAACTFSHLLQHVQGWIQTTLYIEWFEGQSMSAKWAILRWEWPWKLLTCSTEECHSVYILCGAEGQVCCAWEVSLVKVLCVTVCLMYLFCVLVCKPTVCCLSCNWGMLE